MLKDESSVKNNVVSFETEQERKTIYRVVKNKNNPYVQINKTCLEDTRLSWKAKGLLSYMLSRPDDWVFHRKELVTHSNDGLDSLKAAIKELSLYGYVKIVGEKNKEGKFMGWATHVYEQPEVDFPLLVESIPTIHDGGVDKIDSTPEICGGSPEVDFPVIGFTISGKPATTNNDLVLINETTTKEVVVDKITDEGSHYVGILTTFDISRENAEKAIQTYGLNRVKEVVEAVKKNPEVIRDPAAWMHAALTKGYSFSSNGVRKEIKFYTREENKEWFKSLTNSEKIEMYRRAISRYEGLRGLINFISFDEEKVISRDFPEKHSDIFDFIPRVVERYVR